MSALWPRTAPTESYSRVITAGIGGLRNGVRRSHCRAAIFSDECPLCWVKSRHSNQSAQCPLYPQKRTSLNAVLMSALCQKRTLVLVAGATTSRLPAGFTFAKTSVSAVVTRMRVSTNFDSDQCLKFNLRFGWETDVLGASTDLRVVLGFREQCH